MTDAATLLTELERLHHRQADLRSYELHLAERGEDDPASDTWKTAAIVAASAEADFQAALVRNWPALAAFLREAVSPWRPISDEARRADRVLIAWAPFGNIREHVELGWWSAQARAWVNTYGKPFTGEPDAWMPLPAFALPHASGPHRRRRGAQP